MLNKLNLLIIYTVCIYSFMLLHNDATESSIKISIIHFSIGAPLSCSLFNFCNSYFDLYYKLSVLIEESLYLESYIFHELNARWAHSTASGTPTLVAASRSTRRRFLWRRNKWDYLGVST